MKQRVILYADDGMVLTDGKHYGKILYLSDSSTPEDFFEVTQEEYDKVLKDKNKKVTD